MRIPRATATTSGSVSPAHRIAMAFAATALVLPLVPSAARAAVPPVQSPSATAVPSAAAVGRLTPTGCTPGAAGNVTCDLYAMAGTTQILGQPLPIWGFSSTGAAGSATAPGPLLVVNQGDQVTVRLHNQLAQNVSLAFPGQPAGAFSQGLSGTAETTGVGAGGTETYRFTAGRPGSFVYEAGHTENGTRQVAMGLAGALVVLPAGAPPAAYDDESVLVLSEVDPALNSNPDTFDMRAFRPRFKLINGKPFPSTDPVSTDQGHTVLLRYVNVGATAHPMSLLGGEQVQIAQDGHPMAHQEREVVATVDAGATVDTLVTMPTGPESKLTLYEAGGRLDNSGQTAADPRELAFGGMMTFLDTAAPPPSTDAVGPVTAHISVAPNPSDGLADVTVTADLSEVKTGGGQVTHAEFVVDDAVTTGVGFGTPMTGTFGAVTVTGVTGTIPAQVPDCAPADGSQPLALSCLDAGKHKVYVRGRDSAGNWGVIGSAILNLPKIGPATRNGSVTPSPANGAAGVDVSATGDDTDADGIITAAEYFIDTVGADGSGAALIVNRAATIVSEDGTIPAATVAALTEGAHHVFVHSRNRLGLWGPPLDIPLPVDKTGPTVLAGSVGPNPSNGVVTDPGNPGYLVASAQVADRDAQGATQSVLVDAEGFVDPTSASPPGGSGFALLAVDGRFDDPNETVYGLIPVSQIRSMTQGTHHVFMRGQDAAGNWGPLFGVDLVVDRSAPVLGTLAATPNPTQTATEVVLSAAVNETGFAAAEFWTGATDPGVGRAVRVPVSFDAGRIVVSVPLAGLTPGTVAFHLRVQDTAGNWSNVATASVTVSKGNAIFSDAFSAGNLLAWSARSGAVSTSTAAGIPADGTNIGMAARLPGQRNVAAVVTDTKPVAETSYRARFAFNPATLARTNNNVALTVFDARTSNGSTVFAVQVRHVTAGYQVRPVMYRPGTGAGTGTLTGAWRSLSTGAHTLQVEWLSGPATGAAAGTLRFGVDGATVFTGTGRTSTLQVESVRLGVVAGFSATTAGTAYFDGFTSTRYTLP